MDIPARKPLLGRRAGALPFVLGCALAGCVAPTPPDEAPPPAPEPPRDPPPDTQADYTGTFYTRTELTLNVRLQDTVLDALAATPGATFAALLEAADPPELAAARAALPEAAAAGLSAAIAELFGADPLQQLALRALAEAEARLPARVLLDGTLALTRDGARHTLDTLYVDPEGFTRPDALGDPTANAEIDSLAGLPAERRTATVAVVATPGPDGGSISLGPQDLVLRLGARVWRWRDAIDGRGHRANLDTVARCDLLAAQLVARCAPTSCGAATPALQALCEAGVDAVLARARAEASGVEVELDGLVATTRGAGDGSGPIGGFVATWQGAWTLAATGAPTPATWQVSARRHL